MTKPNLVEMIRNERRIEELGQILLRLVSEFQQVPEEDVTNHVLLKSRIEEYRLEYKERMELKKRKYRNYDAS